MQVLPIDLTAIIAVIMGVSVVLVPVIGVTARFALKPTIEALSKFFDAKGRDEALQIMERRMALMEQQIEAMDSTVRRLREVTEFHEELSSREAKTLPHPSEYGDDAPSGEVSALDSEG